MHVEVGHDGCGACAALPVVFIGDDGALVSFWQAEEPLALLEGVLNETLTDAMATHCISEGHNAASVLALTSELGGIKHQCLP